VSTVRAVHLFECYLIHGHVKNMCAETSMCAAHACAMQVPLRLCSAISKIVQKQKYTASQPHCLSTDAALRILNVFLHNTLFHMKVRRSELLELPWV
jgi:hypothetical protein